VEINRIRGLLEKRGIDTSKLSDEAVMGYSKEQGFMEELLKGESDQGKDHPLLGTGPSGTGPDMGGEPTQGTTVPKDTGTGGAGTWETAAMAVSRSVPAIIESLSKRQPNAATPNIAGRRVMDIPTAGGIYGKREPGFQSLLARLLAGGR